MDPAVRRAASEQRRLQQALYEVEGTIGEGAFGVVLKARVVRNVTGAATATTTQPHAASAASAAGDSTSATATAAAASPPPPPPSYVAIKKMLNHREGQGVPQDAYREIKILRELRHPNLVRLERVFTRPEHLEVDLVYEYAEHDLAELTRANKVRHAQAMASGMKHLLGPVGSGPSDARVVKSIMFQLLQGLAFLHKSWCMHRDLKPANILVTKEGKVKIADFGLARIFQSPLRKLSDDGEVVTIWYRAPEVLLGAKHYTRALDLFAVGAIFYEIMTCQPLFPGAEVKPGGGGGGGTAAAAGTQQQAANGGTAAGPQAGTAAAAAAAVAASNASRPFQEHQVREVFKVLGKPSPDSWPNVVHTPHYPLIKSWNPRDYGTTPLGDKLAHIPLVATAQARDLLARLLAFDPARRISAEEALGHPYFTREAPAPSAEDCFLDSKGGRVTYNTRPTKHISSSKRMREHEGAMPNANAAASATTTAAAAAAAAAAANGSRGLAGASTAAALPSNGSSMPPPPSMQAPAAGGSHSGAAASLPSIPFSAAQQQRLQAAYNQQQHQRQMQQQQQQQQQQYQSRDSLQPPNKMQRRG